MKTNDRYEDSALREVMVQQAHEAEKMQLPEDFADQVMLHLQDGHHNTPMGERRMRPFRHLRKVAAGIIAVVSLSGLAFATWHYTASRPVPLPADEAPANLDSVVTFSNVRLDSILHRVGKTYGRSISFHDQPLREWRFQITWNPSESLEEFLLLLSEFDGLSVTERNDTIFVGAQVEEETR